MLVQHPAVAIMARAPSSGGKSRLAKHLDGDTLVALRRALVADSVAAALASRLPVYLFATPESNVAELRELTAGIPVRVQDGCDLGRRMANAVSELLAAGHDAAILIGTDIPQLGAAEIAQAASLVRPDVVVLGPADDGGYYLVATARDEPALFDEIEWGTGQVTRDTIVRAEHAGVDVALLRRLRDLDTPEDLVAIRAELAGAPADTARALRRWFTQRDR